MARVKGACLSHKSRRGDTRGIEWFRLANRRDLVSLRASFDFPEQIAKKGGQISQCGIKLRVCEILLRKTGGVL
jgi:hypothetical protein